MHKQVVLSLLVIFILVSGSVYAQRGQGRTRGDDGGGNSDTRQTASQARPTQPQNQRPWAMTQGVDRSWRMPTYQGQRRYDRSTPSIRQTRPIQRYASSLQQYAVPRTQPRSQGGIDRSWRIPQGRYTYPQGGYQSRQLLRLGFNTGGQYNRGYRNGRSFNWVIFPLMLIRPNLCVPGYWAYDYYGDLVWVRGYCNIPGYRISSNFYWP